MTEYILAVLAAYVIGSIPSGLILGKLVWHTDLRAYGSHNIGATNAWRTLGKAAGIAVFLADSLKGQAGVYMGLMLVGTPLAAVLCGLAAIVGHSFSVFLRFRGGKGVATSLGVLTMLMGNVTLIVFLVWLAVVYTTRYVSLVCEREFPDADPRRSVRIPARIPALHCARRHTRDCAASGEHRTSPARYGE